jgi:Aspartyl/Asparaginyl beta-hydroxylase
MPAAQGIGRYIEQVARNNYSSLVDTWHYGERPEDARACAELAVRQRVWAQLLQRDRDHIPGLRAQPVHDPAGFWFVAVLEDRYPEIRAEIEAVLDTDIDPIQPTLEDGWLTRRGSWRQAYLFREGCWQQDVCAHFPVTRSILAEIPEVTTFSPGVILVSRLSPGTHIIPHCGSTNAVLRIHLAIKVPPQVSIRVADRVMTWDEGKCLIFDDSFEHEVRHDGTEDRIVLIMDMAHPELDTAHRERLLARRPSPEERITAFMRERGIERIAVRDGRLVFTPDRAMRELVTDYMAAARVRAAEVTGDQVRWQRLEGGG